MKRIPKSIVMTAALAATLALADAPAREQRPEAGAEPRPGAGPAAATAPVPEASPPSPARQIAALGWAAAGTEGQLFGKASFKASEAYSFLGQADTDRFLQMMGNPPHHTAVLIAPKASNWFGVLEFADEGYVKDDEAIDADALLVTLKEHEKASNEARQAQGFPTLQIQGWAIPPRYDREHRRLEWGTLLRDDSGDLLVNVSTRLLGRSGFTSAVLVTEPDTVEADLRDFKTALQDFHYVDGERYSDWKQGDKVAAYGLGALVLGGAAAAAASKGGLKGMIALALAALGAVWTGVRRIFGRRRSA